VLRELIQEVTNKVGCQNQTIQVGPLYEGSVFLKIGPACDYCESSLKCKNELIDKITETFNWITQVKVY
jgi:hypothetical protein